MSIFAENAHELARLGLAVIPLGGDDGKRPLIKNFGRWRKPPSQHAIARFASMHPDANIGVITGLSGVVVVDCDHRADVEKAIAIFGMTPLRTQTARGLHLWYGAPEVPIRQTNLRRYGLAVDVKAGSGYVVAPPSVHKSGVLYSMDGCNWAARHRIPAFNTAALDALTTAYPLPTPQRQLDAVREGQRHNVLNNSLCRQVGSCADSNELLEVARMQNSQFLPPLENTEVAQIAKAVWNDFVAGRITRWQGGRGVVKADMDVVHQLTAIGKNGSDAVVLELLLKATHSLRCDRDEAFSITPKAMASAGVLPGWSRERIEKARDILLGAGRIKRVREFESVRRGARYILR